MKILPVRLFLMGLILSAGTSFGGPLVVGNGSGLGESHVTFAWTNISEFIQGCTLSEVCAINNDQKAKLNSALVKARKSLIFKSGAKNPNYFLKKNTNLLAFGTKQKLSSQIYINLDSLSSTDQENTLARAIGILASALIYQNGTVVSESEYVGEQVELYWSALANTLTTTVEKEDFSFTIVNNKNPQLIYFIPSKTGSLNIELENKIAEIAELQNLKIQSFESAYWIKNEASLTAQVEFANSDAIIIAEVVITFSKESSSPAITFFSVEKIKKGAK